MAETIEQKDEKISLVPRWALIAGIVILVIGIGIGATRETRTRSGAVAMLNNADIRLVAYGENKPITDGYEPYFGRVVLNDNRRPYEELLGECTTRPDRALAIFREVLTSGSWKGKALACHMAFYLAQEDKLEASDLDAMVKLLEDANEELRRVAHAELATLVVVRNSANKGAYETLGPPPPNLKERFAAAAVEVELPDNIKKGDWLRMKWSCPEACQAWWKAFGSQVKWDTNLKRFTLTK